MVQKDTPGDYVVSTGEQHSVREFCEIVANRLGFNLAWEGEGLNEVGINKSSGKVIIRISEEFYRPAEVNTLLGDCTKAKTVLGWKPEYSFEDLVHEMVQDEWRLQSA